jgi:hypothetical protein
MGDSVTVTIVGPDNEEAPGFPELWRGQLSDNQSDQLRVALMALGLKEVVEGV